MSPREDGFEADIRSRLEIRSAAAEKLAHAVLAWSDDEALAQARGLDARAASGGALPALAGLPVSVKAIIDVAGWTTHAGSRVLEAEPPAREDAPIIAALRRLGAIILAQTNMVEFAYGALGQNDHFGTPYSPVYRREKRLAGGSSSGAAVTVAVGLVDAAVGTDTSGSVRIPAAFCGIAGFKPTQGRYDSGGIIPLARSLDTPGLLARSIATCARIDAALFARAENPEPDSLRGKRFAVPRRFVAAHSDARIMAAFDKALHILALAKAEIVEVEMDYLAEIGDAARRGGIIAAEAHVWHATYLGTRAGLYNRRIGPRIAAGANIRAVDYVKAREEMATFANAYAHSTAGFAAVLTPTCPIEPPEMSDIADDARYLEINAHAIRFTEFANRINVPSLTLPIGGPDAAIGLLVNGHRDKDGALLALGRRMEAHLGPDAEVLDEIANRREPT